MKRKIMAGILLGALVVSLIGCRKEETSITDETNPTLAVGNEIITTPQTTESPSFTDIPKVSETPKVTMTPELIEDQDDTEEEGITEKEETEKLFIDSDGDGVSDEDELTSANTDPLKRDTDGDGIDDGEELVAGLDPCSVMSDGKIPDAERDFVHEVELEGGALEIQGKANVYSIYAESSMSVGSAAEGIFGPIYEFYLEGEAFDTATLTLHYDPEEVKASGFEPENLQICQVFPDGTKEPVVSSVNDGKGTVTATLEHFSEYALGDVWIYSGNSNKTGSVIIADSGFEIGRDSFSFSNYSIYRNDKVNSGQCFGMAAVAQLYYCGKLPLEASSVPIHHIGGLFAGGWLSGASYDFTGIKEIEKSKGTYFDNSIPLQDLFQVLGYKDVLEGEIRERDPKDFYNMIFTQEFEETIKDNPFFRKFTVEASEGTFWEKGDKQLIKTYDSLYFNLDNIDVKSLTEEQRKQYQLFRMINHWQGTQETSQFEKISFDSEWIFINERKTKAFNILCNLIDQGVPVIVSGLAHSMNVIRVEKNPENPLEYFLIVYDNNNTKDERKVTVKLTKKRKKSISDAWDATYWNNTYEYSFFDTDGAFFVKGKEVDLEFFYSKKLDVIPILTPSVTPAVKPIPIQKPTVTPKPTITPMTTAVPQPIVPQIPMPTSAPEVTPKLSADVKVGDEVTFGVYEQDTNLENGSEKIIWKVIGVEDGKALLLSKYCLDNVTYNDVRTVISWKDSKIRNYLNREFYETVFSKDEKACIVTSIVTNERDERFESTTEDGETTKDNVFLLSKKEVEQYLTLEERQAEATLYAKSRGLSTGWGTMSCDWYIRTTGGVKWNVGKYLKGGGWSQTCGSMENGLRPAIWVDLANVK